LEEEEELEEEVQFFTYELEELEELELNFAAPNKTKLSVLEL